MSIEIEDFKLSARAPLSPAHSVSTLLFATICLHPLYFKVFRASEVLRIRILEVGSEIWTSLDPHPRYIMQIMLSGSSEFKV